MVLQAESQQYFYATGRRKSAIAKVRLYPRRRNGDHNQRQAYGGVFQLAPLAVHHPRGFRDLRHHRPVPSAGPGQGRRCQRPGGSHTPWYRARSRGVGRQLEARPAVAPDLSPETLGSRKARNTASSAPAARPSTPSASGNRSGPPNLKGRSGDRPSCYSRSPSVSQ